MPKPSAVPTWNTDGTNRTTPTGGQIATGIVVGEAANSSRMNYLLNLIGQWLSWIDAGVLTGVSYVASGVITAGGLLTALAGLAVTGAVTISTTLSTGGLATLNSLVVSTTTTLTGALTAAAGSFTTLASSGLSTLNSLVVSTTATITGALTGAAATFSGLITANAGVTAGANQHVTVSGTGQYKRDSNGRFIGAHRAGLIASTTTKNSATVLRTADGLLFTDVSEVNQAVLNIELCPWERLTTIVVYGRNGSSGLFTATLKSRIYSISGAPTAADVDSDSSSGSPGAYSVATLLVSSPTDYTPGEVEVLTIQFDGGGDDVEFHGILIRCDVV